jgi:uncharacterized glyoxalase superfamily protein PhnB
MIDSMTTNIMVLDVGRSVRFYRDVLGAEVAFVVDADQQTDMDGGIPDNAVFASVRVGAGELMMQERASLAEDGGSVTESSVPGGTFTMYFRVDDVDAAVGRLPEGTEVVKPLETTWYGMKEIWVRDPDGYVITIGTPDGPPPQ